MHVTRIASLLTILFIASTAWAAEEKKAPDPAKPHPADETTVTPLVEKSTPEEKAKKKASENERAQQPPPRSIKELKLKPPEGFDLTLFAAPPQVAYPACVAATPTGELFVGIDELGTTGKGEGRGRIVRCVDSDGDGIADQFTVFAKVDHPRGLIWDAGRLFVVHPPFLSVYYDDNNDGVADRSEDLIKGISTEATVASRGADHTSNGVRLAIDGWLYLAIGDFGCFNAIGKDGTTLRMRGGGVLRVRPDGSDLEIYCSGTRNIFDVAIDPLMNVFTRDNTNDGDGWNDRLSYMVPSAFYGYPSLFRHFAEETIPTMIDFGGGAPTGALFVDEPAIPGDAGHALYTLDWGRNVIDRHPLTGNGAGFKAITKKLMDLPRAADMDVDGQGHFYASSWANGTFNYNGPNVGYVLRLSPKGAKPAAFPDIKGASDEQLLQHLASPSGVCRLAAQREILRRGEKHNSAANLTLLAASQGPLSVRVAAIFTLRQLLGSTANDELVKLMLDESLREFALRALADKKGDREVPAGPFLEALKDPNPRVRLQGAWGLARLGRADLAPAILPLMTDADPIVSHVAISSLMTLHAADECLKSLDDATPALAPGAVRVLQTMHDTFVVDGLIDRLDKVSDATVRTAILRGLCRLYYREADWDGKWWSIRPDTAGPYFKRVEWEGSPKVRAALLAALGKEKPSVIKSVIGDLQRNQFEIEEASAAIAKAAEGDPELMTVAIDALSVKSVLNSRDIALARSVATSDARPGDLRVKSLRALTRTATPVSLDAATDALAPIVAAEKPDSQMQSMLEEFIREPRHARNLPYFGKLASSDDAGKSELAWSVLVTVAGSKLTTADARKQASDLIAKAWDTPARSAAALRAIGRTKADGYREEIEKSQHSTNATVAQAAAYAAERLAIKSGMAATPADLIESLGYEKTVAQVATAKGDPALGKELFTRQGCIACHTVSPDDPPKGPMLAAITARYSRAELCESILKPSAKIAQGFDTQWFKTKDGDEIEGFVVRESGEEIEIRNIAAINTVLKKDQIKQRGKRETSIMPEGLVTKLTPHDLASLIAYLDSLKGK